MVVGNEINNWFSKFIESLIMVQVHCNFDAGVLVHMHSHTINKWMGTGGIIRHRCHWLTDWCTNRRIENISIAGCRRGLPLSSIDCHLLWGEQHQKLSTKTFVLKRGGTHIQTGRGSVVQSLSQSHEVVLFGQLNSAFYDQWWLLQWITERKREKSTFGYTTSSIMGSGS